MNTDTPTASQPSESCPAWSPPSYHIANAPAPSLLSSTTLGHDPDFPANFPRTAKWCADGSSLVVQCENRSFQTFTTPTGASPLDAFVTPPHGLTFSVPASSALAHAHTSSQPAPIVDFAWYPGASRHDPRSFCFVASVRDCPVKLLDARDGRLRASYPIVDHRERYVAPHSLAFNVTADRLYCGFEDAIEIFDVQRPGQGERLPTTPSKKSKDGLKGVISALAFSYSPGYYAAGSFTPASRTSDNIALFNESTLEPVLSVGGVAEHENGGVTQLMFNPTRPHVLYAAFRRSERLWSWDLRGDPSTPLRRFSKSVSSDGPDTHITNQRRRFDVEGAGRWLASGTQRGEIAIYDLGEDDDGGEGGPPGETGQTGPELLYDAHGDAIGAVAFHPLEPILVSVSGARHFDEDEDATESSQEGSDSDSESSAEDGVGAVSRSRERPQPSTCDVSIKMWGFKGSAEM